MQVDVSRTKRVPEASAKSVSVARSGKDDLRTRTLNSPYIGGIRRKFPGSDLAFTNAEHTRSIAMEKPVREQWRSWERLRE